MKRTNNRDTSALLVGVLSHYLRHWRWFIVSLIIALVIALGIIITTSRQYKPILSILLNEDNTSKSTQGNINLESIGIYDFTNNIDNEILIISSPDLMKTVVKSLNLNINYYQRKYFRKNEIYKKTPFVVSINDPDIFDGNCCFYIEKVNSGYEIEGSYYTSEKETKFSFLITSLPYRLILDSKTILDIKFTGESIIDGDKYYIKVDNIDVATSELVSKLAVTSASNKSSVLNLSISVNNIDKGIDILNELVYKYNDENSRLNRKIAFNTSQFINDRLKEISVELSDAERGVVEYKQEHNIADLDSEAQMFVAQTGENDKNLMDAETQINILKYIQKFIDNPLNKDKIIPNMDISDVGLSQIIQQYNSKLLASDQLLQGTGSKNPARIRVINELDNMVSEISGSLANVKETYMMAKRNLQKRSYETQSNIRSVPKQEKGLIEKVREQKIKENLFLYLMQKREETNLSIAATSEKARIISSPASNIHPISPKSKLLLLEFAIMGILIPIFVIYIYNLLNTKISNRSEFEQESNIPIIGEITICKGGHSIVNQQDPVAELFRTLRNNIKFVSSKRTGLSILVTSTTENEGKTFISINLALSFAHTYKKVLFIDGNLREHKSTDSKDKKGLSDYLISEGKNWKDYLITPYKELNHFQVLPPGMYPSNPNELLLSIKLKKMLNEARLEYDYVIIDSAPIGVVSDSYIIGEYTDLTLYIVRENKTSKAAINFINKQQTEYKLQNIHIVMNGIEQRHRYGYKSK